MENPQAEDSTDNWKVVTHRRRPKHFLPSSHSPPRQTTALSPLSLTYAQVVQMKPPSMPNLAKPHTHHAEPQTTSNNPTYFPSLHSPTLLRYPPNPLYHEWRDRCFRCTRKGHVVAECKYPRLNQHQPSHSAQPTAQPLQMAQPVQQVPTEHNIQPVRQAPKHNEPRLNPTAPPFPPIRPQAPPKRAGTEPTFEEFLAEPEPSQDPLMPANRPRKARCYFNRDDRYFQTLAKMMQGIVVEPPHRIAATLSLDQVAVAVAASTKVTPQQLQVARLSHRRFLVLPPPTLLKEEVVAAIPRRVWDDGFKFHSYSPLSDSSISIPLFKVWIDILGVPVELHNEMHMARAVSSFGLYLGSVEPRSHGDCQTWTIFVATDDLALIPHELEFKIGGMVHIVSISPRKWIKGQVYHRHDLPPTAVSYNPPPSHLAVQTAQPTPHQTWPQDEDLIPMSLKALKEIFKNFTPSELPQDLADCLAGKQDAIDANHARIPRLGAPEGRAPS